MTYGTRQAVPHRTGSPQQLLSTPQRVISSSGAAPLSQTSSPTMLPRTGVVAQTLMLVSPPPPTAQKQISANAPTCVVALRPAAGMHGSATPLPKAANGAPPDDCPAPGNDAVDSMARLGLCIKEAAANGCSVGNVDKPEPAPDQSITSVTTTVAASSQGSQSGPSDSLSEQPQVLTATPLSMGVVRPPECSSNKGSFSSAAATPSASNSAAIHSATSPAGGVEAHLSSIPKTTPSKDQIANNGTNNGAVKSLEARLQDLKRQMEAVEEKEQRLYQTSLVIAEECRRLEKSRSAYGRAQTTNNNGHHNVFIPELTKHSTPN